eukprot:COSAG01_NODE_5833_length_4006_cov_11.900691_1_plen_168_part_10
MKPPTGHRLSATGLPPWPEGAGEPRDGAEGGEGAPRTSSEAATVPRWCSGSCLRRLCWTATCQPRARQLRRAPPPHPRRHTDPTEPPSRPDHASQPHEPRDGAEDKDGAPRTTTAAATVPRWCSGSCLRRLCCTDSCQPRARQLRRAPPPHPRRHTDPTEPPSRPDRA